MPPYQKLNYKLTLGSIVPKTTMNTETIAAAIAVNTASGPQMLLHTVTGVTVFVPKDKYDATAETVTYEVRKKGDKYVGKDGKEGVILKDGTNFRGLGKLSKLAMIQALYAQGLNPTLAI